LLLFVLSISRLITRGAFSCLFSTANASVVQNSEANAASATDVLIVALSYDQGGFSSFHHASDVFVTASSHYNMGNRKKKK
jgi:hypothetical protein